MKPQSGVIKSGVMSGREKRKRTAATAPVPGSERPRKQKKTRGKPVVAPPSPPHPHGEIDLEKEYRIRSILKATKTRYLIDWEDDEVTGEKYAQTWEPKANANQQAIDDWERQKIEARKSGSPSKVATPVRSRGRSRKIIDSSPPTPTGQVKNSIRRPVQANEPIIIESPRSVTVSEQDPSDQSGSPLFFPETSQIQHPVVDISDPPSSILAGDYQKLLTSQVEPSSLPGASVVEEVESFHSSNTPAVGTTSLPRLPSAPLNLSSTVVIPDSQTLIEPISTNTTPDKSSSSAQIAADLGSGHIETAILATSPPPPTPIASICKAEIQREQSQTPVPAQLIVDFNQKPVNQSPSQRTDLPSQAKILLGPVLTNGIETVQIGSVQSVDSTPQTNKVPRDPSATNGEYIETVGRIGHPGDQGSIFTVSTTYHDNPTSALDGQNSPSESAEPSSYISRSEEFRAPSTAAGHQVRASSIAAGHQEDESGLTQESQHSRHTLAVQRHEAQHESIQDLDRAFQISTDTGTPSLTAPSSPFPFQTQLQPSASIISSSLLLPALTTQPVTSIDVLSHLETAVSELPQRSQSPVITSSPVVPVPSQLLTLGESAPRRLTTPSSPLESGSIKAHAMDIEHAELTPTEKLAQRLKAIREGTPLAASSLRHEKSPSSLESPVPKAGTDASTMAPMTTPLHVPTTRIMINEARRSPSVVPALRPEAIVTTEEMNTSERFETLIPQVTEDRDPISQRRSAMTKSSALVRPPLDVSDEAEMTHVIPIGLLPGQRDQYRQTVFYHQDLIQSFMETSSPGQELLAQATKFVHGVRNITLHPDLENPETMVQIDVTPSHQAQWDIDCSTKCRFLKHLVDSVRDLRLHVTIVCRPGRILMILNTFLASINAPLRSRQHMDRGDSEHEGLAIEVISTDNTNAPAADAATPDLVIIMEPTITKDDIHRAHILPPTKARFTPVIITLLVPGSVEHVAWSLAGGLSDYAQLRSLIGGIYKFRKEVGKLQDDQMPIEVAALAIAGYMRTCLSAGSPPTAWPLSDVTTLLDLDSQTDSVPNSNGSLNFEGHPSPTSNKRALEDDDAPMARKRACIEEASPTSAQLPTTIDPREIDLTHISDSIEKSSGIPQALSTNELRLQALLQDAQARVEGHADALRVLQYDHEELRSALYKVTTERNEAVVTAEKAIARLTENSSKIAELRVETRELRLQIDDANVKLQHHAVPEQAAFQRIRLEAEVAKQELQKAEVRIEIHKNDLAYAQEMYQKASSEAQAAHAAKDALVKQLDAARSRVTDEQARLKQIGQDEQTRYLRNEVKKLRSIIHEREISLKLRDEELSKMKEANRGRMGTRGGSVPRSPRLSSPKKLDRGGISRQSSPAGVEVRNRVGQHLHPLRNA